MKLDKSFFEQRMNQISKSLSSVGIDVETYISNRIVEQRKRRLKVSKLKDIKIAAIMDRFTLDSYSPECKLLELTPSSWKAEINDFNPDFIFVESAWQGKDGLWYTKIAHPSVEFVEMTHYAHQKEIPIIFWNKEDPVHTETFMQAASLCDVIFTTDIDCIQRYKTELEKKEVYYLHFAAQPAIHNPIEKFPRKDKYCFAGAYYHRFPERAKTFDEFCDYFDQTKGIDIFDRNLNNPRPEFLFPERYNKNIVGTLDPSEIDIAYKGYYYGINMNSVSQSQTMFARRVFELLASNTIVVGNYSRGVKNLFGDLTICTNDVGEMKAELESNCASLNEQRRYRLAGLRKVLSEHLYEDRLSYIVEKVFGVDLKEKQPLVSVVSKVNNAEEADKIIEMFEQQSYQNKKLIFVWENRENGYKGYSVVGENEEIHRYIFEGAVSVFDKNNYYGVNFITDLMLTFRYADCDAAGKSSYYFVRQGEACIDSIENTYKYISFLKKDRSVRKVSSLKEKRFDELFTEYEIKTGKLFSADEFNFCEGLTNDCLEGIQDLSFHDMGIGNRELQVQAEKIIQIYGEVCCFSVEKKDLEKDIPQKHSMEIKINFSNDCLYIDNKPKKTDGVNYLYFNAERDIKSYICGKKLRIKVIGNGERETRVVCFLLNSKKEKSNPFFAELNKIMEIDVPNEMETFTIGIRLKGDSRTCIKKIQLGIYENATIFPRFITRENSIILTNNYPSYDNLYRNMFVHARVREYKNQGALCDVVRCNANASNRFREFEGINVWDTDFESLSSVLTNSKIKTVMVHFLDEKMWTVLKDCATDKKIIIWCHGADIKPWWRRTFLYKNEEELERAKRDSEKRQNMWKDVFANRGNLNLHFVFVSKGFFNEIIEDYDVKFEETEFSIIHNYINKDIFKYRKKDAEQRKKVISIRPYASTVYANDLTVKCIIELSKKSFFNDLQFYIAGDGVMFDEVTAPLKKFKNVKLEKRFFLQIEIANLYKNYGIVLIPSRDDTQGVSRDEAMATGVVPITTGLTTIQEFLNEQCVFSVPCEDYVAMADCVEKLYYNEDLFLSMSEKAPTWVDSISGFEQTIKKELVLFLEH